MLAGCLSSIQANSGERLSGQVETIVVDNASNDGSFETIAGSFPWVRLIQNQQNVGFARANNQGILAGRSPYVLLLNSDTVVQPGAFEHLLAFMDQRVTVGAAGPRLLNGDGSLQPSAHPMMTPGREFWRLLFLDTVWPRATYPKEWWNSNTASPVEVLKGAAMMLRREALEKVGVLDEDYFMYSEEVDFCYRLKRAGWELWYVPAAVVTHFGEASTRQERDRMFLELYRSKVRFFRKSGGTGYARRFKLLALMAYLPRVLLQPRTKRFRHLLAELPQM